jgi:hypothetical protein
MKRVSVLAMALLLVSWLVSPAQAGRGRSSCGNPFSWISRFFQGDPNPVRLEVSAVVEIHIPAVAVAPAVDLERLRQLNQVLRYRSRVRDDLRDQVQQRRIAVHRLQAEVAGTGNALDRILSISQRMVEEVTAVLQRTQNTQAPLLPPSADSDDGSV